MTALQEVSFTVKTGEFVAIMGPSGSGKTSLLQILGGLEPVTGGEVLLDDNALHTFTEQKLTVFRRKHIGYIFQSYNLIPGLTVAQNVGLPGLLDGRKPARTAVLQALDKVGLGHRSEHKPSQLSGGEQQRAAFARAILHQPSVILGDEPTASLDSAHAAEILKVLRQQADAGKTVVMITHDYKAAAYSDRIIEMRDGKMIDEVTIPARSGSLDARLRLQSLPGGGAP